MEKLQRLRRMTAEEIGYRLRERLQIGVEKVAFLLHRPLLHEDDPFVSLAARLQASGINVRDASGEFSFKRYLETLVGRRFYFDPSEAARPQVRCLFDRRFPGATEKAAEEADRLCAHRVPLLGYGELELGPEIDWHKDPVTGRRWPIRFWFDYDLVRDEETGDPKVIHELNRQQHLPRLGKAYFLTGEERYAREAIAQIESWLSQNPPGRGVNWQSSLEIGLRAISWLWTIFFILPAPCFDESVARAVGKSLFAHFEHVCRYPSIFSSPNTHLIGEATALFLGGLLFEPLEQAAGWRRIGASLLEREIERQVLSDGVYGELSSYYHCYALDFYLQAVALADRNHLSFSPVVRESLQRMTDFLMHLTRPDGTIPLLGDDDGGRALALDRHNYREFRDALCTGAVLFGRPDFKHQAGAFRQESFWLLGNPAWDIYDALDADPPDETSALYRDAGYLIQRSGWAPDDAHLVFDCGGFGIANGAHSHADALSVNLFSGGAELIADPGTFVYNRAPEWRGFFRSTRAHSTVVIDDRDQSEAANTFDWKTRAAVRPARTIVFRGAEYAEGEHSGYARLPQAVVHRRRLLFVWPDYWVVLDDFRGQGEHQFDVYYHFPPAARLCVRNGENQESELLMRRLGAGLLLFVCAPVHLEKELICGQNSPVQAWVSPAYGNKMPAPVLRAGFRSSLPASVVSFLLPLSAEDADAYWSAGGSGFVVRRLDSAGAEIACSIESGRRRDFVTFSADSGEREVAGFRMQGEFFWLSTENDELKRVIAINARSFRHGRNAVFESNAPLPGISARFVGGRVVIERGETNNKDRTHVRHLRDRELRSA